MRCEHRTRQLTKAIHVCCNGYRQQGKECLIGNTESLQKPIAGCIIEAERKSIHPINSIFSTFLKRDTWIFYCFIFTIISTHVIHTDIFKGKLSKNCSHKTKK